MVAKRDIEEGEELTNSYVDELLSRHERQKKLLEYGFICNCDACEAQKTTTAIPLYSLSYSEFLPPIVRGSLSIGNHQ